MAISDWIKPKWKHSDPEVRLGAVRRMGPDDEERLRTLALADADHRVRVAAVERIADEAFLREIAGSQGDGPAQTVARERLVGIYRARALESTDPAVQRDAVARLADEDALFEIACAVADPEVRLLAAERISDPERLCELTRNHCGPLVGQAAVNRLDAEDLLRRVAEGASSKKIKRAAREKLEALTRPLEAPDAAETARCESLCERMEALAESADLLRLRTGIDEIQAEWDALSPGDAHPLTERLDAARAAARLRERKLAAQEAAREELVALCVAAEGLADAELDAALSEREALRPRLDAADASAASVLADSVRAHYRNRFEAAGAVLDDRKRRREADAAVRRSEDDRLDALCREAESLAAAADAPETVWEELQDRWDAAGEIPPELAARMAAARRTWGERRAAARASREAEHAEAAGQLQELVERVEAAARAEDRTGLESVVRKAREAWRSVHSDLLERKAELAPRFEAACDEFFRRQREFRDHREWEWWANRNRKEELCRVAEALADVDALEGMATAVRDAHREWKEIGPVAREHVEVLWERFGGACNRAYQRCLERKRALLETVREATAPVLPRSEEGGRETEAESAPPTPPADLDWASVTETVKAAQAEWNAIGPLPAALAEGVRGEFRTRCDRYFAALREFYDARDAERRENLARKTEICEAAEALADSEDWAETAGRLKALQRRWRDIGPVPREANEPIWNRFRTACDAFFQRLKAREPAHVAERESLVARAEERVAAADAEDADMDALARELMALQKAWKEAAPVPPEMVDALWERFHEPCNRFFERYKGMLDERKSAQSKNEARKTEMVETAESLADSTDWRDAAEALKALQREWREIGPAPRRSEQALWNRFRAACDRFFQGRNAHFDARRQEQAEHHHRREELCAAAEALVRLVDPEAEAETAASSPTEDDAPDMAAEQLRAGLAFRDEVVVPGNPRATRSRATAKVRELQAGWKRTSGGRGEAEEQLWRRFRAACDRVYAAANADRPSDHRSAGAPDRSEDDAPAKSPNRNGEEARA